MRQMTLLDEKELASIKNHISSAFCFRFSYNKYELCLCWSKDIDS